MALDAYASCPCGSGKKFKWCCQPIHAQIDHAMQQDAAGQHEAALKTMDEVVKQYGTNPEVWGRQAQLLYNNGRPDEAENALQKAFDLNPQYAFGHLLRGLFRQQEGEIAGALLLFRKAAEYYDPEARDILVEVYSLIGECELKLGRPVAAHAALKIAHRCRPSDELQKALDDLFGENSALPLSARKDYGLKSPHPASHASRLAAWERARGCASSGKLIDLQRAFEQLTNEVAEDSSAWYNLAIARAWLGDNARALDALERYIGLEQDDSRAAAAGAFGEVLRFGQGMEDQADYVENSVSYELRNPQQFFSFLQQWEQARRLTGVQVRPEENMVMGLVLDRATPLATSTLPDYAHLGAYMIILGPVLRFWTTNHDALNRVMQELQQRVGPSLSEGRVRRGPAQFSDVLLDALVFPVALTDKEAIAKCVREQVQKYFEDSWVHRPLKSLGGLPPTDAANSPLSRKKLLGVIQFLQECAQGREEPYDFDQLRRKLGLLAATPASTPSAATELDPGSLGPAELTALPTDTLTDDQLEQACQAAQKLDARELACRFAEAIVARPPRPERPDRFPWYTLLMQLKLAQNDPDGALERVDEGEKADCEQNEGRRRNDYELWRARLLSKRGDAAAACDVFDRLIERAPSELRFRSTAAEMMLSARNGPAALRFAEQGLAKSREQNNRDSEHHFMELVAAAKKQVS